MRTLAIVLGGVGAGGLAALLAFRSPTPQAQQARPADSLTAAVISDTGSLLGPRQPIFFRHDIHAGQFKIQCQYCHYSVAVSPEPGIPSMWFLLFAKNFPIVAIQEIKEMIPLPRLRGGHH